MLAATEPLRVSQITDPAPLLWNTSLVQDPKQYHVYIMASRSLTLYIGITGNLRNRVFQHKVHCYSGGFTAKYKIERLVYCEAYSEVCNAIAREKQLKNWRREKKLALSKSINPAWVDLAEDWYSPATLTGEMQQGPVARF